MSITREDVLHLAELSSISLDESQIEPLIKDLDNIVNYFSQLDELNTENVEPTYQCFDMQNVWREDNIVDFEAKREDLLALTTESEDNQIKVPKVL
ncbi:Asp-tRNA(Asn)/Glu-tRNA(Gln) amidotransferase subunit GatC [Candidatus Saccharibacteria bacterium]|jgi:aspartyl-tRNA(Asn)/glutamyl-tRNA(Gln) amidotransferase subunit C|nr:Asp-tRNA(Asn)/Glu-tRNA(Gln) amidotransferase subunit GatC [Candidatus Saccharibacteria bacterium]MBR5669949.1 Asp-tRNA(Asn)/Glu-tRNA(Gln) amidotransferase subunit GatC [Candidatus Saccharibacteria bacterium]